VLIGKKWLLVSLVEMRRPRPWQGFRPGQNGPFSSENRDYTKKRLPPARSSPGVWLGRRWPLDLPDGVIRILAPHRYAEVSFWSLRQMVAKPIGLSLVPRQLLVGSPSLGSSGRPQPYPCNSPKISRTSVCDSSLRIACLAAKGNPLTELALKSALLTAFLWGEPFLRKKVRAAKTWFRLRGSPSAVNV
jgi:hypothetical protein